MVVQSAFALAGEHQSKYREEASLVDSSRAVDAAEPLSMYPCTTEPSLSDVSAYCSYSARLRSQAYPKI